MTKEIQMKNFIAMHKFHSEDLKQKCFEAIGSMSQSEIASAMTGGKAACQGGAEKTEARHDGGTEKTVASDGGRGQEDGIQLAHRVHN